MFGYQGKILRIDLSSDKISIETVDRELYKNFLGGRGLGVKIFLDEVDPKVDPLDPKNKIVITTGPLTGTGATSSSICAIVTKSPLTNTIISAQAKLYFGAELKAAGYDGLIIEGKAKEKTLLFLQDDRLELLEATHLNQTDTNEAEALIKLSLNDPWIAREIRVLSIGEAGEELIPFSSLVTDGLFVQNSVGLGAVFGAKNLKAIAIRGTKDILIHDGKSFLGTVTNSINNYYQNETLKSFSELGTYLIFNEFLNKNILSSFYFSKPFTHICLDEINPYWQRQRGCFCCPIACLRAKENGEFLPELDAFIALGPLCGIDEIKAILDAHKVCLKKGLDPVETGASIALLMSLKERGALENVKQKIKLDFGDKAALVSLLTSIGNGENTLFKKGAYNLAKELDRLDLFMGIKGRSAPFNVKNFFPLALHYATSPCGPTHLTGFIFGEEGLKERDDLAFYIKSVQDKIAVLESMGICPYVLGGFPLETFLPMLQAAIGVTMSTEDLLKIGEMVFQLEHEFNKKVGFSLEEDNLPKAWLFSDFKEALSQYYRLRGWD
jgi:aldehyde:ferredoxin oxidoreductase